MRERIWLFVGLLLLAASTELHAQPLAQALDAPSLTWTTTGTNSPGWIGETVVSHDGLDAAATSLSSNPSGPQTAILQTTVVGPGAVSFWWFGSNPDPDTENSHLIGYIDTTPQITNSTGTNYWYRQTMWVGSGSHTLKWVYTVPGILNPHPGYVDEVIFSPGVTAPSITIQPFSQSVVPGLNATFSAGAYGTPPLLYQWQLNGTNIAGATNISFTVTNAQPNKLGNYHVVVSNSGGTNTSADAALEFGEVAIWGEGSANDNRGVAPLGATNVLQISGGWDHSVLLKTNGTVLDWGSTNEVLTSPDSTVSNLLNAAALVGAGVILNPDGTVTAWGNSSITNIPPGLTNVVAIAPGPTATYCLALKSNGTVVGWGSSAYGVTSVPSSLTNIVSIAAGDGHGMALRTDGTIAAWGDNTYGQRTIPVAQLNSSTNRVVAISAGGFHSLALRSDGAVFAWGQNGGGQTNVPTIAKSGVMAIAAGFAHSMALKTNGTVVVWGRNEWGQTNMPSNLSNVVAIAAGGFHSLALVGTLPTGVPANANSSSNTFSFSIPSQSGHVFELDYKTSISDTNWNFLPLAAGNGANLILMDPNATNSQRFYRVRRW